MSSTRSYPGKEKHTFIFDFDDTCYAETIHGSYLRLLYEHAFQRLGIDEPPFPKLQAYIEQAAPRSVGECTQMLAHIHQDTDVHLEDEDFHFSLQKIKQAKTPGLEHIMRSLIQQDHQVLVIGGGPFGCRIIPAFVQSYGIKKEHVYSGHPYDNHCKVTIREKLNAPFCYINASNHRQQTPISDNKSELIKQLQASGQIQGKIIHIGDGENDLEAWKANAVHHFIGFGLHTVRPLVQEGAPTFVHTLEEFCQSLDVFL